MDERTKMLISLGAATAANCIPCFEYLFEQSREVNLTDEEIQEAVDIAGKVKSGAQIAMRNFIGDIMGDSGHQQHPCEEASAPSCCD
jgi:alkylhydroperoxidase/carboxymuconolactone decarboxylase family protein YurZ